MSAHFLTVGELREAMQGLPDDAQVAVTSTPGHTYDLGVTEATVTWLTPWDHVCPDDDRPGLDCPAALGLDLELGLGAHWVTCPPSSHAATVEWAVLCSKSNRMTSESTEEDARRQLADSPSCCRLVRRTVTEWREPDAEPQTPAPADDLADRLLLEHGGETVDEFVCHDVTIHGEVMSDECYWIGVYGPGGRALMVNIVGSGLVCHVDDEGEGEWPWGEVREHDPDVPQADSPPAPVPADDLAERIAQAIHADYAAFADSVDPDEYHAGVTHGLSRAMSIARSIAGAR